MKPKSNPFLRSIALASSIVLGFAASASATVYQWNGSTTLTNTTWTDSSNWSAAGVAPTGTTVPLPSVWTHRLNVQNGSNSKLVYSAAQGTTNYTGDTTTAGGGRGLVIGNSGGRGELEITGGSFSTLGSTSSDVIGNGNNAVAILTIDGGSFTGSAAPYNSSNGQSGTCLGIGWGPTSTLTVRNNGTATLTDLTTNNTTANINIESGGVLAINRVLYSGGGTNNITFDGGTLRARAASTSFIGTPTNGWTNVTVKSGGAIIDTNGFDITIARPVVQDATSTGGGITKNGGGLLTLSNPSTTTGPLDVNAGGLSVRAAATSWVPSSFSHSGNLLNFDLGVYNPSNQPVISTGALTIDSAITVNVSGSNFSIGTIPLIDYDPALDTITGSLTLNTTTLPAGVLASLVNDDVNGLVYLDVTQAATVFTWSGDTNADGSGDWDTVTQNWNNNAALYALTNTQIAIFPNIAGGGTVNVTDSFSPIQLEINNTSPNHYQFDGTGGISGATKVIKSGTGIASFATANSYTGGTAVNAGTLTFLNPSAKPASGTITAAAGATVALGVGAAPAFFTATDVNALLAGTLANVDGANLYRAGIDTSAGDFVFSGDLGPSTRDLAKYGPNTLTLSGNNTFDKTITVTAGTLSAGGSGAFAGTFGLALTNDATFDLNGYDAAITSLGAGATTNVINNNGTGAGLDTLTIAGGSSIFVGEIQEAGDRTVAVRCGGANTNNVPNNANNNYSGGLTLFGNSTTGPRLNPYATVTTLDTETGAVVNGPYGTGAITIGEDATQRAQLYFNAANRTIDNDIVVNSSLGTDTVGAFRVESTGHVINGAIQANLASAVFRNNVTGGSAGVGAITLAGPVSTGTEPTAGLMVVAAGVNALSLTLNNDNVTPNSYTGPTTVTGANATLVLGGADQIPNGPGKGNLVMTGAKLDLAGYHETINGLSGNGTVDNLTPGSDNTLTIGDGDADGAIFSGVIADTNNTLSLVKTGAGTQTLSGNLNSYDGPTTVNGGTLLINGDQSGAGGPVQVNTATIGGTGTIGGTLTIASTGAVNPAAPGTTGTLTTSGDAVIGGTLACDVSGSATDVLAVGGDLNLTGSTLALNPVSPATPGTYVIATYQGNRTGTLGGTLPAGFSVSYDDTNKVVELVVVATASSYTSWAASFAGGQLPDGDFDFDGVENGIEYFMGIDAPGFTAHPGVVVNGAVRTVTWPKRADFSGSYQVQVSDNLSQWLAAAPGSVTDTGSAVIHTLPAGERNFVRLVVTPN